MDIKLRNDNLKFKYRVSAVIINNNKLLVNKYGENSYCLPGGYVEIGETSEQAVLREAKEEIGYNFKIDCYLGIIENFFTNIRNEKTHGLDIYYKLVIDDNSYNDIKMERMEHDKHGIVAHHFKWIDLNKIENYNLLPSIIKNIIKDNNKDFHIIIDET